MGMMRVREHVRESSIEQGLHADRTLRRCANEDVTQAVRWSRCAQDGGGGMPSGRPQPIQEVRNLTRPRKQLTREIVQHTQRIQAVLEEANIKLTSVITDILGTSGRRILKAIVAGETDPLKLAELGGPRLAATKSQLADALLGRVRPHHRFLIEQHLKTIEQLEETITAFDARIETALEPFRDAIARLKQVPGLSETSVQILLAEIGTDMSRFPTAGHLLSWAGLIPRLDESAGKRRSTRVKKGAPWL